MRISAHVRAQRHVHVCTWKVELQNVSIHDEGDDDEEEDDDDDDG